MKLAATPIAGVFEAQSQPIGDQRGRFARLFCAQELAAAHGGRDIVQVNYSMTSEVGAIRGLHYQLPPKAEGKWIRCLRGKVFDVAVDLRLGSPTFLKWHAVELDASRMNAVFIPEGCAHGFQVLEAMSELLYLHTMAYDASAEAAVRWDEPRVSVAWPLPPTTISGRDRSHPYLDASFGGIDA